jgi:hypothetical protein
MLTEFLDFFGISLLTGLVFLHLGKVDLALLGTENFPQKCYPGNLV